MGQYAIKDDYEHRTENATLEENPGDYWDAKRMLFSRYVQWHVYDYAARQVREHGCKTVLDVGCGLGHKLIAQIAPLAEVTGVDQPTAVEVANKLHPDHRFVSADIEKPDETSLGAFDFVLCADVIEHLLDPDLLLRFITNHAHADSLIVVSTVERDIRRGKDNRRSPKAEHVREWNLDELGMYLRSFGFDVIDQQSLPAFRVGRSATMIKERIRLIRKGIAYRYSQVALCRPPCDS